jgi:hypothetical protein
LQRGSMGASRLDQGMSNTGIASPIGRSAAIAPTGRSAGSGRSSAASRRIMNRGMNGDDAEKNFLNEDATIDFPNTTMLGGAEGENQENIEGVDLGDFVGSPIRPPKGTLPDRPAKGKGFGLPKRLVQKGGLPAPGPGGAGVVGPMTKTMTTTKMQDGGGTTALIGEPTSIPTITYQHVEEKLQVVLKEFVQQERRLNAQIDAFTMSDFYDVTVVFLFYGNRGGFITPFLPN